MARKLLSAALFAAAITVPVPAPAADLPSPAEAGDAKAGWPQFMRDPAHTGDAADEVLALPLGLVAQVKLDDAVMTSPAVVGGLVYVVDQLGTAYCVDPKAGRVVWKTAPEGEKAMGSNTSSPCVAKGRMCYGTTAGNLHILDIKDGKVVKSVAVGMPIVSPPAFANDSIYFQALDAVIRCFDLDGNERWNWDHYKRCAPTAEELERVKRFTNINKHLNAANYGGSEVAVSGRKVVAGIGWDVVCLEDQDKDARQVWVRRRLNEIGGVVSCLSISGDNVHATGQARDGFCLLGRLSLATGALSDDFYGSCSFPWVTFPVRGDLSLCRGAGDRLAVWTAGEKQKSRTIWKDPQGATPLVASPVLAGGHVVAGTLNGDLLVVALAAGAKGPAFTFKTPSGKGIGAAPAVSGGCVHFGCDDGYLYVLGPGTGLPPKKDEAPAISARRSVVKPATGKTYGWATNYGNAGNTCFVDDPGLVPPFKVRWAVRAYGHFKSPGVTTEDGDLITISYQRTVTCLEQATGRTRWRVRLPPNSPELLCADGLLVADGRLYVPCPAMKADLGRMLCLDLKDGRILWSATMGSRADFSYMSPVLAGGKVAFASTQRGQIPAATIQAWDALTGAPAWKVELAVTPGAGQKTGGCAADGTFYYTTGGLWNDKLTGDQKLGETVAIEAGSGKVLWKTNEYWGNGYPVLAGGGRLLLFQPSKPPRLCCLSTKDGSLLWAGGAGERYMSIGQDFIAHRYYGGYAGKLRLEDGMPYPGLEKGGQLGGTDHACTPVTLTPKWSLAPTADGLNVRDVKTGALAWHSPGFAPKTCAAISLANGRAFMPTAASGMLFCWEPEK